VQAGVSLRGLSEAAQKSVHSPGAIERGRWMPSRDWIDAYLRLGGGATYAELAECYGLVVDQLRFPSLSAVESLSEYVGYLQRVNNLTGADTARLLGIDSHGLFAYLDAQQQREATVLRIWRLVFHRAGPYNDLASAWGYRYRMDPLAGDVLPRPDLFASRDFAYCLRHYHTLTREQWASRTGLRVEQIALAETEHGYSPPQLRTIHDAGLIPDDTLQTALNRFHPLAPAAHHTIGSWLAAQRRDTGITQEQLAVASAIGQSTISDIENNAYTPRLRTFRRLCDALDIHGPPRIDAVRRFYSDRYPIGADPDDEQLFWRLIETAVDSPQDRELRNQIYERYARIAGHAARRWAATAADRDNIEQVARAAILTAIVNHTPTSPFIAHAFATCRGAIRLAYLEARYPDLDPRTRRIVSAVAAHLRGVDRTAPTPDPADIAAALRLNDSELRFLNRTEVDLALQILSQPAYRLDQPDTGASGDQIQRQLADPAATTAFADSDFVDSVRAALAELPDPDTATRLVVLHLVEGIPLDQEPEPENGIPPGAAQQLGLSLQSAAEIISTAIPRLRMAFSDHPPTTRCP
jgi:transcriptional regulator with XRE-family HTH domain